MQKITYTKSIFFWGTTLCIVNLSRWMTYKTLMQRANWKIKLNTKFPCTHLVQLCVCGKILSLPPTTNKSHFEYILKSWQPWCSHYTTFTSIALLFGVKRKKNKEIWYDYSWQLSLIRAGKIKLKLVMCQFFSFSSLPKALDDDLEQQGLTCTRLSL